MTREPRPCTRLLYLSKLCTLNYPHLSVIFNWNQKSGGWYALHVRYIQPVLECLRHVQAYRTSSMSTFTGRFLSGLSMWSVTSNVYKKAKEPGLPTGAICTQLNGRKHNIFDFMEIAMSSSYQFLIWWKGAHLKTCPAFTFITLEFKWKLWHKMSTFL